MATNYGSGPFLARVNRRWQTPAAASVLAGLLIVVLSAVYFLVTSVENAFYDVILILGLLPLGAAGFLGRVLVRSIQLAPWSQRWSFIGIVAAGPVLMVIARAVPRSPFFQLGREIDAGEAS